MRRFPLVLDLESAARRAMPKRLAGYVIAGADSESGTRENRSAFERMRLVPRYGLQVLDRTTRTPLFERTWSMPVGIAPVGLLDTIWPGAEAALAAAAKRANVPFILSTFSGSAMETIAPIAGDSFWFQLYAFRDLPTTLDLLRRAKATGCRTLVVTMDTPVYSKRARDYRNGLAFPPGLTPGFIAEALAAPRWTWATLGRGYPRYGNLYPNYARSGASLREALVELLDPEFKLLLGWEEIRLIRREWPGTLVLKGLQHPGDVARAADAGADGVIVSNHGGRQLDAAPATLDSLPAIVEAAGDRLTVMLDSGIRSGLDIAKAFVRGARFTFAGRPFVFACAAAGTVHGPDFVVRLLAEELSIALAQLGVRAPDELRSTPEMEHGR
jgi:L-lactate dehydrogenase (cytochrome)